MNKGVSIGLKLVVLIVAISLLFIIKPKSEQQENIPLEYDEEVSEPVEVQEPEEEKVIVEEVIKEDELPEIIEEEEIPEIIEEEPEEQELPEDTLSEAMQQFLELELPETFKASSECYFLNHLK